MARKIYDDECKIAAARLVSEQGHSARQAALGPGVDRASIRGRVRQ